MLSRICHLLGLWSLWSVFGMYLCSHWREERYKADLTFLHAIYGKFWSCEWWNPRHKTYNLSFKCLVGQYLKELFHHLWLSAISLHLWWPFYDLFCSDDHISNYLNNLLPPCGTEILLHILGNYQLHLWGATSLVSASFVWLTHM